MCEVLDKLLTVGDSSPLSLSNGWPCIVCKLIGDPSLNATDTELF